MPSVITCPGCKATLKMANPLPPGKTFKCPKCATVQTVPAEPAAVGAAAKAAAPATRPAKDGKPNLEATKSNALEKTTESAAPSHKVICTSCKASLKLAAPLAAGKSIKCPKCGQAIKAPATENVEEPAANEQSAQDEMPSDPAPPADLPAPALDGAKIEPATSGGKAAAEDTSAKARRLFSKIKVIYAAGLLLLILACVGAYFLLRKDPGFIPDPEWQAFNPPMGHCQIMFPGEPVLLPPPLTTTDKPQVKQYQVERPDKFSVYSLTYTSAGLIPNPREIFQKMYNDELANALNKQLARLRPDSERFLTLNGHFGREFQVDLPAGRTHIQRIYLVEGATHTRFYFVTASGPWRNPEKGTPAKYFESFKLPPRSMEPIAQPLLPPPPIKPPDEPKPPEPKDKEKPPPDAAKP